MNVQLKLFATLRQYLPPDSQGGACDVQIPAGASAHDLLSQFGVPIDEHLIVLVHGRHADLDQPLKEGDTVAAFPAMAGGASGKAANCSN
jgi:molybdopterin converting factor small subunit